MFFNCVNIIKLSIKYKKKGFIIHKNNNNMNIIKNFIKINLIKYIFLKNNKIVAFLNYYNNRPVFKNIINLFSYSNKKTISLKNIKKINNKHNWIILISTNKGILNNFEAEKLGVGGLIIAKIWN